ncbi:serine hydrolase domain-containing protein [Alteribacter aurantiacus]|uniref:serine hydrolase domain-containing protein n=1 Tax=Alteribacter aurantiacus TaxID=254410 RepID=UPI0004138825|nr:serine hydrolase domain-containing protein [Alteribacter aurantiacus]
MKQDVLALLDEFMQMGEIPGAVVSVSHKGEVILEEAVGYRTIFPDKQPMKRNTVFDVASLTKVTTTLPAVLLLLERGKLRLDDKASFFLPKMISPDKEAITIKHLLTHTSGLPAHRPYYEEKLGKDEVIERIYQEKLEAPIGEQVIYSCLGFILLYKIVETITGERFDRFVEREVFEPLEMTESGFNPDFPRERYAATEYSEYLNDYKHGVVHDDNAEWMGGVSGNAGLFSTVGDLQKIVSMFEQDGVFRGKRLLSPVTTRLARENLTSFAPQHRGLGWDMKSPALSSCGDFFSDKSYGHTGYTGTSLWIDPEAELSVILLTNRVHFGREKPIVRLRPLLHNIVRAHIID